MGRNKTLPDIDVFAALRHLLIQGGDKAVAFSSVAQATGLAAPTLAQRYGTRDAMVRAALRDGWDVLGKATDQAVDDAPPTAKGATQIIVERTDSDVSDPETMRSFEGKPLTVL